MGCNLFFSLLIWILPFKKNVFPWLFESCLHSVGRCWAEQHLGKAWDSSPISLRLNFALIVSSPLSLRLNSLCDWLIGCWETEKTRKKKAGGQAPYLFCLGFQEWGKPWETQETKYTINQAFSVCDSVLFLVCDLTPFCKALCARLRIGRQSHCEPLTSSLVWNWIFCLPGFPTALLFRCSASPRGNMWKTDEEKENSDTERIATFPWPGLSSSPSTFLILQNPFLESRQGRDHHRHWRHTGTSQSVDGRKGNAWMGT